MPSEFDSYADDYATQHAENIRISGEAPDFFAKYKVSDAAGWARDRKLIVSEALDFGAGIGNSVPHFRALFPDAALTCADVSERCLELIRTRFPGQSDRLRVEGNQLAIDDAKFDLAFTACTFHHIDKARHIHWLSELRRVVRKNGLLVLFEHNPLNPLTLYAVNTCPFDKNARLIDPWTMRREVERAGWKEVKIVFRLFFPGPLAALRPIEKFLTWLPLGAQYAILARAK